MGITERRAGEKKEMRERILGTAMKLFLKEGFERVTIRAIAREIEYSPATIYLYFKDKNEILYALAAMGFEKLDEHQQELRAIKDPWKRLRQRGEIYFSFALKNPEYFDLMFLMRVPEKQLEEKKKWELGMQSYEMLKKDVSDCMQAGYLIKTDADVAAFSVWSFVHGVASLIIRDRAIMVSKKQIPSLIENVFDYMLHSLLKKGK